jgi:HAD superfamily hydrolase (TIGR01509 family)
MSKQGAIFDLDGTLLDTMPAWATLAVDYLLSVGVSPKDDMLDTIKYMTMQQTAEHFQSEYGLDLSASEIVQGINAKIESFYFEKAEPKKGVNEFLTFLKSLGVKMCVVTATDKYLVEAALSRCGLLAFFDDIITCGDFGAGKDTPAIFEYALGRLGTEKRLTPVFEDALHAAKTAKNAGFPVVAAYDDSFADCESELRSISDLYARDLSEAMKLYA